MSDTTSTECTCKPPITTLHICAEQAARAVFLDDDEIGAAAGRWLDSNPQGRAEIEALIEQSSLGTPQAKALRSQTPTSTARAIVLASKHLGRAERAEATVAMLSESLTETCKRAEEAEATLARVAETAEEWIEFGNSVMRTDGHVLRGLLRRSQTSARDTEDAIRADERQQILCRMEDVAEQLSDAPTFSFDIWHEHCEPGVEHMACTLNGYLQQAVQDPDFPETLRAAHGRAVEKGWGRPCQGSNANVCAAEGCFGQLCKAQAVQITYSFTPEEAREIFGDLYALRHVRSVHKDALRPGTERLLEFLRARIDDQDADRG